MKEARILDNQVFGKGLCRQEKRAGQLGNHTRKVSAIAGLQSRVREETNDVGPLI